MLAQNGGERAETGGNAGEQARMQHGNAGKSQRFSRNKHLSGKGKIAARFPRGRRREQEMGKAVRRAVFAEAAQVGVAPDVGIDDEKRRFTQQRQGLDDAAGGFQPFFRFARVVDAQAVGAAVAERVGNHRAAIAEVDDHFAESGMRKAPQLPADKTVAADAQQRFGAVGGQRAHAFAASGGEDHGFHVDVSASGNLYAYCVCICCNCAVKRGAALVSTSASGAYCGRAAASSQA